MRTGKIPAYPLFIGLGHSSRKVTTLHAAVARLNEAAGASRLLGVNLYYQSETDTALVCLRLDARQVTASAIERIRMVAAEAQESIMDPALLSTEEREELYGSYLARYDVQLSDLPGAAEALELLAQRVGAELPAPDVAPGVAAGEARFQRGDLWLAARPRGLTHEGVFLASSAPPPAGSRVAVQLTVGSTVLRVHADVLHVTAEKAGEALGWGGFGVRFVLETADQRSALDALLAAARGTAMVTSATPPRRAERRYPIEWPALVSSSAGIAEVTVLDMSRSGMFVVAASLPNHQQLELALAPTLEVGDAPIEALARVARTVGVEMAQARDLTSGFGLELLGFTPGSEPRYLRLVERVARRIGKSLLIGASVTRLGELCFALAARGYTTVGASDAPALVARAQAATRPPDLVVVDASLGRGLDLALSKLHAAGLAILTLDDEPIADVRQRVDARLLGEATPARLPVR